MLSNDPERRYTYGGRMAHLLIYGANVNVFPGTEALCGYAPRADAAWLGSGSQNEEDKSNRLPLCPRCAKSADTMRRYIAELTKLKA